MVTTTTEAEPQAPSMRLISIAGEHDVSYSFSFIRVRGGNIVILLLFLVYSAGAHDFHQQIAVHNSPMHATWFQSLHAKPSTVP